MQPKYQQIEKFLLYELKNGDFKEGDKFYSEAELKKKFDVSSFTVIKALNELVNKGILFRQQGKGTFISKARQRRIVRFTDQEKYHEAHETAKVISVTRMKDAHIASELQISATMDFYHLIRLRIVNGIPVMVQHSYVLPEYVNEQALNTDLQYYSSIYERIREDSGIDLFNADFEETSEIIFPVPKNEGDLLELTNQTQPVAFIKRHSYLFDHKVVEYIESYKRWDYFAINIETV